MSESIGYKPEEEKVSLVKAELPSTRQSDSDLFADTSEYANEPLVEDKGPNPLVEAIMPSDLIPDGGYTPEEYAFLEEIIVQNIL